jgi:nucleotide-binding universal stress UspA family protein
MLHAQSILCPVHPGASTHPALQQALSLAESCRAELHVVPLPQPAGSTEAADGPPLHNQLLDVVAEATSGSPLPPDAVHIALDDAPPALDEVLAYVDEQSIDLVVIDTPPDRGAIPALASDPTRRFVTDLSVPVFVTGRSVMACDPVGARHDAPSRRILVPTDFSENSMSALRHAFGMAAELDAEIDVLHVMDRPQYVALNATDMLALSDATLPERKARRRVKSLIPTGTSLPAVNVFIRHGDAADQIGQFATERDSDLLVMSTHGTISRKQHPLGHVVERVLRRVARPVFLARAFGTSLVPGDRWALGAAASDGAPGSAPEVADPEAPDASRSSRTPGWRPPAESEERR